MAHEYLLGVILAPRISEKSTLIADKYAQYTFRVAMEANKAQIKQAVEMLFEVEVDRVQVLRVKGKTKRFGKTPGRRRDWKKAYVCLKSGQEIQFVQEP
ncbi:MAG: 50S ribosomal protein L23 [Burkholderiales bacterium]